MIRDLRHGIGINTSRGKTQYDRIRRFVKEIALSMGFKRVAPAPLVRSSYYAEDL